MASNRFGLPPGWTAGRRPWALVAAALLSMALAAIAGFLLLRGGAPLSIEASYNGSELTLELSDGASITLPVGAAALGARVRISTIDPADLPDLPEFATGVWGAWDFDVEGGVLAPVTIRLPVSPADQSWVLARFKDGVWISAGFELVGDRAVAIVDSVERTALLKVICVAGTFPSFDPSCESFLLDGFTEGISALWKTFDPEPCPNPDSSIKVINDEGAELVHGCTTVQGDDTQLVVGNLRNFFVDIHPSAGSVDEISHSLSLPSCCGGISVVGGGTSSWSGEVSGEAPDIAGRLSFEAVTAQIAYFVLDLVPGLGGISDPALVSAVHHAVISAPTAREAEQTFERGDTLGGLSQIANILSDRGFVLDVSRAITQQLRERPNLLLRVGARLPLELIAEVFKLFDFAEVATTLRDIQRAFIEADGEPEGLVQFRRLQAAPPPPTPTLSVSAGWAHTCAVQAGGSVVCWGDNDEGQASPPGGEFTSVSAGWEHTCGIRTDRSVVCWGNDEEEQSSPPAGEFISVSAGRVHSCGVRANGSVECWGEDAPFNRTRSPEGAFISVSATQYHSCGVLQDGSVACWGYDQGERTTPPPDFFTSVSVGGNHSCGIRTDGSVACWGHNEEGQATPPPGTFVSVSASKEGHRTCGVRTDGSAICWGAGIPRGIISPEVRMPVSIQPEGRFSSISAGAQHVCGIKVGGNLACWGSNDRGPAVPPGVPLVSVSLGDRHECGLGADGSVACHGSDVFDFEQTNVPPGSFTSLSSGLKHNCAIKADGSLTCWGWNWDGQATAPAGTFVAIDLAWTHSCGLRESGEIECWGQIDRTPPSGPFTDFATSTNGDGCGLRPDGSAECWGEHVSEENGPPDETFTSVAVGWGHACGIRADGTVACWGSLNASGEASPPDGRFAAISLGNGHSCGLREGGEIECWGENGFGQAEAPDGTFTAISTHTYRTCAVREGGDSYVCWGE